ncbi:MAG: histidine kinase [Myxococcales bacterium]|nr:MAG: histidine kinase [Myxococcales bacterium]
MHVTVILIELAEKMGLLASAALVAVLLPPLRAVVLGRGRRIDKLAVVFLGLGLSAWGGLLGLQVGGEHINLRGIGILIAAVLGGPKAGLLVGLGGGLLAAARSDVQIAPWVLFASFVDGTAAGYLSKRYPDLFKSWRSFFTCSLVQALNLGVVGIGLLWAGDAARYVPAWPAHLVKISVNPAAVTLFLSVAHLVMAREQAAVDLSRAQSAAEASALQSLRQRLEPHFLFNALNALRATIRRDPHKARELVSDLADLYRYLLRSDERTTLKEELDHAQAYLAIERLRLGEERIGIVTQVPSDLYAYQIPSLVLQPLVENAIKHGIAAHKGAGVVTVTAQLHGGDLEIAVEDQCQGAMQHVPKGAGIALDTLKKRLHLMYSDKASLELCLTSLGARSVLRMPVAECAP